jgi:hypothetical protein
MEKMSNEKKTVKTGSGAKKLLVLNLILLLPLYGLYFLNSHVPGNVDSPKEENSAKELLSAAHRLSSQGFYESAENLLWQVYYRSNNRDVRLKALEHLKKVCRQSGEFKSLIKVLHLAQSVDPDERQISYRNELHDALQRLGKASDARAYLKSVSALNNHGSGTGVSGSVVARIGDDDILYEELESAGGEPQAALEAMVLQKLVLKESAFLLEDEKFLAKVDNVLDDLRMSEYLSRHLGEFSPTDSEINNYFQANKSQWDKEPGYVLYHILLSEADSETASQVERVENLQQFRQVAASSSKSLDKVDGGKIKDPVNSDLLPGVGTLAGLRDFLKSQKLHKVSQPFQSSKGIHYFWIESHQDSVSTTLEQVKDKVLASYREEWSKEKQKQLLEGLWQKYDVQIFPERIAKETGK